MAVEPTGYLGGPMASLRTMLSECASFQTWVGAEDATEALESIFYVALPRASVSRPFALVSSYPVEGWGMGLAAQGSGGVFRKRGQLFLLIEDAVAAENLDSKADAEIVFLNNLGSVMADMEVKLQSAGNLTGMDVELIELRGPDEMEAEGEEASYQAIFGVAWGFR